MGFEVQQLQLFSTSGNGGGDKARGLILNQHEVAGVLSTSGTGAYPHKQYGVPGAWRRRRPGRGRRAYPQPIWGPRCVVSTWRRRRPGRGRRACPAATPGAWCQPEEDTETRPEGLSSSNRGPRCVTSTWRDGGGDKGGGLILKRNMRSQAWSRPDGDEGRDKAGALILNQNGVPGVVSTSRKRRRGQGRRAYPQPTWGPRCGLNFRKTGLSSQAI